MKEMYRAGDVEAAKPQIVPAVGNQVPRIFHRLVRIGQRDITLRLDTATLIIGEFGPEQILGEVRRCRDADQPGDTVGRASATFSINQPPSEEPTRICGPSVNASSARQSDVQLEMLPSRNSPLDSPWPR